MTATSTTTTGTPAMRWAVATTLWAMLAMLGCVYYPWAALHRIRWLQIAVLANPMVYVSEGLRAALTPQLAHMPTVAFLTVLLAGTVALCMLAMRAFTRRVLS
jgi:ABC-2 type transport system permease protein